MTDRMFKLISTNRYLIDFTDAEVIDLKGKSVSDLYQELADQYEDDFRVDNFEYWLENNYSATEIYEMSKADELDSLDTKYEKEVCASIEDFFCDNCRFEWLP